MTAIDLMLLTGEWMLRVLFLILIARPVARILKYRFLMKYRRQMGWLFGALTIAHLIVYLFWYLDSWGFLLTLFDDLWFITGLIATLISLILTFTSNNWAVKKLRKKWRYLHMTTYIVGPIGILHGEIASKQTNFELYFMLVAYALLLLWRFRTMTMCFVTIFAFIIAYGAVRPNAPNSITPTNVELMEENPKADQLCGQYGYNYFEHGEFYNCERTDK